jgi:hypothetical protein
MPWDFGLEGEGYVFLEEGDAVFAGVGGGSCGEESQLDHFWYYLDVLGRMFEVRKSILRLDVGGRSTL